MATKPSPVYDDEIKIDFGKYIETLVRQWLWIVVCALGLGFLVGAYSMLINRISPSYRAVALVSSAQTVSEVNFGSAISSTSDVQLAQAAAAGAQYLYDRKARLQSYVSLVQNGAVVEQVLQEVGPKLINKKGEPIAAASLLRMVSAVLIPNTDTIRLSVTYNDPVIAAEIANAWGNAYVQRINELYGGSSSGTSNQAIQEQTAQAKTDYEKAQAALDDFIAHNKIAEYSHQSDEISSVNNGLLTARTSAGNQQVADHLARLDRAYSDSRQIGLFLDNAVSMRAAVNSGGESAAISNALALTMLKTQIYAAFQGTNTLQVQNLPEALGSTISTVNAAGMVADLDALISTLKTRQTELDTLINTLSSIVENEDYLMNFSYANNPIEQKILENQQKIQDLQSLISTENSTLNELTRARDQAWQTYSALTTKSAEMGVAAQTSGVVVVFSSPATPPEEKVIRSRNNVMLAAGVGLLIGVIVAYAYEFWQNYKGRQPGIITKNMFAYAKDLVHKKPVKTQKKRE